MALFIVKLYGHDGCNKDRNYPVSAHGTFGAMLTARTIAPDAPIDRVEAFGPFESVTHDELDRMNRDVERWFGECYDQRNSTDGADWEEILDIEDQTVRELCNVSTF